MEKARTKEHSGTKPSRDGHGPPAEREGTREEEGKEAASSVSQREAGAVMAGVAKQSWRLSGDEFPQQTSDSTIDLIDDWANLVDRPTRWIL